MNLLTPSEAAERLGVSRQAFNHSILPLLAQRGEAQQISRQWAIDGKEFWQWEVYAATRKNLIEAGVWIARRPWSVEDLEDIVIRGMYEDYGPPTAWPQD